MLRRIAVSLLFLFPDGRMVAKSGSRRRRRSDLKDAGMGTGVPMMKIGS